MKTLLAILLALMLVGCAKPAEEATQDTSQTEEKALAMETSDKPALADKAAEVVPNPEEEQVPVATTKPADEVAKVVPSPQPASPEKDPGVIAAEEALEIAIAKAAANAEAQRLAEEAKTAAEDASIAIAKAKEALDKAKAAALKAQ